MKVGILGQHRLKIFITGIADSMYLPIIGFVSTHLVNRQVKGTVPITYLSRTYPKLPPSKPTFDATVNLNTYGTVT